MSCGSSIPRDVRGDQAGPTAELAEGLAQGSVSLASGPVEAIVRGELARRLPDRLDRIELRRVRWQPEQRDPAAVVGEPLFSVLVEVVAGSVVDDQKDLATSVGRDEVLEEDQEGLRIEDVGELVAEPGVGEGYRSKDVSGLALTERVDAGLVPDPRPGSMECSVEPEADFVSEEHDAPALCRFFLIRGKVSFSQTAWRAASARARRLRGRCTEKPSLWRSRGT